MCRRCTRRNGRRLVNSGFNATESGGRRRRLKLYEPYEENIAYASPQARQVDPRACSATLVPGTVMCPITATLTWSISSTNGGQPQQRAHAQRLQGLEEAGLPIPTCDWSTNRRVVLFPGKASSSPGCRSQ